MNQKYHFDEAPEMTLRKNHIPTRDHGTHLSTLCGAFPKTIEECLGGHGVCSKCKKNFIQTPEQIRAYTDQLIEWGKRFTFKT
jgi:DNA gyrase/topoisomerase IV subunit B